MNYQTRDANGLPLLLIGLITNNSIAASNLLGPSNAIAMRLWRSAATVLTSMNRPINAIPGRRLSPQLIVATRAGVDQPAS